MPTPYPVERAPEQSEASPWHFIRKPWLCGLATFASLGAAPGTASAADCHTLVGKTFGDATVLATELITPPFSIVSLGTAPGRGVEPTVPFCRVRGTIKPTRDSDIRFEVWLPEPAQWNGRYEGVGNGGFAGNMAYSAMAWAVEGGFAVAATDTGHVGASSDSSWAVGHPERIVDLGSRAIHETAVTAKAITAQYYGKAPLHSYYAGCSTGGRQGLVEAQRFPEDYDGIVVGAPAYNWPRLLAFGAVMYQKIQADPLAWLSPDKLELLNQASLKTCHGVGGLIDDPGSCKIDPAKLLCRKGQSGACLNASEVAMARLMYDGIRDSDGKLIYPGFTPGLEKAWGLWNLGRFGSKGRDSLAYPYPTGFYGNLLHQDPDWSISSFRLDSDLPAVLDGPVGAAVYAENPDLRPFFARGGKLIQYHGWHDPAIPANSSLRYYQSVVDKIGDLATVQQSYRLFLGTGMFHCAGGPGPNAVGGWGWRPPVRDAGHDMVAAIERWVEAGVAPDQIVASHYKENNLAEPVDAQRPWCAWPQMPLYKGGDRSLASSYSCVAKAK